MDESFYQMIREDCSEIRHLKIVRDARGSSGIYHWRDLTWARPVDVAPPLMIAIRRAGESRDIAFEVAGGAPVLTSRAAGVLRPLAGREIALIPARVEGESADYFVLNVLNTVRCLDEGKTRFVEKWTKNSYRPDRAGEYKTLRRIAINPKLAAGHQMFRLWGTYSSGVMVSGAIKEAFEREGLTGGRFVDACSPGPLPEEETRVYDGRLRRYDRFYEQVLKPLTEAYGPVREIISPIVGFDGGGPVKVCTLGTGSRNGDAARF